MPKKGTVPPRDFYELVVPLRDVAKAQIRSGERVDGAQFLRVSLSMLLSSPRAGEALAKKVVNRAGARPLEVLGVGLMGVAIRLSNGTVLKLTRDLNEVLSAAVIMSKKPHPNVVRFKDVFVASAGGMMATGVIVREAVATTLLNVGASLTERGADPSNPIVMLTRLVNEAARVAAKYAPEGGSTGLEARREMKEAAEVYLLKVDGERGASPEAERVRQGIVDGMKALMKMGVYGYDFHAGNIGLNPEGDGQLTHAVIYDIGLSSVPERRLESVKVGMADLNPISVVR